jgi:hypothetical protein
MSDLGMFFVALAIALVGGGISVLMIITSDDFGDWFLPVGWLVGIGAALSGLFVIVRLVKWMWEF